MKNIADKMEARYLEASKSFKSYESYENACKVAQKFCDKALEDHPHFKDSFPLEYIPVFMPNIHRWVLLFRVSEFFRRNKNGGYIGFAAEAGHWSI